MVKRLVYPVSEENHVGLGVHLTLDLTGRMKLGPDATYIQRLEDYRVDVSKRDQFYEGAVRFLPFIHKEDNLFLICPVSGQSSRGRARASGIFVIREDLPGFGKSCRY